MAQIQKKGLTSEQKKRWKAYCKRHGKSESDMLEFLIEKGSGGEFCFSEDEGAVQNIFSGANQINIRLDDFGYQKLLSRMEVEGFRNKTRWVSAVVRHALTGEPVLNEIELIELRRAIRELGALGRNLNQIARAINIDFRESDKINQESIKALASGVDKIKIAVVGLVNRSLQRWCDE